MFLGGLAGGAAIHKEGAADKALLANFRAMLNHLVFTGLDKRMWVLSAVLVMTMCLTNRGATCGQGWDRRADCLQPQMGPLHMCALHSRERHLQAMPAGRQCSLQTQGHLHVLTQGTAQTVPARPSAVPADAPGARLQHDRPRAAPAGLQDRCGPSDLLQPRALHQACTATHPDIHAIPPGPCAWSAKLTT